MGDSASYGEFVNKVRACSSVCSKTCSRSRQHSTRSSSARRFFELAGQADATTSGGDNESSAGQLPTGGDTVLIAEGEWNGMPLSFECQSSQHEFPRLQYFWQNAGLPLYQIRCRTTDDEYQVWFDQAGEAVQQYDYPLGEPVDGGIGFGSLSGAMLNQHAESKVVNRVTVSSFVADERIEGSFEASWEGGDDEGFISGVFRVAPKPE